MINPNVVRYMAIGIPGVKIIPLEAGLSWWGGNMQE